MRQEIRTSYELDLRMDLDAGQTYGRMEVRPTLALNVARLNLAAGDGRLMDLTRLQLGARDVPIPAPDSSGIVAVPLGDAEVLTVEWITPLDELIRQPFDYYLLGPLGPRRFSYPELLDAAGRAVEADFDVRVDHPASLTVYTTGGAGMSRPDGVRTVTEYRAERVRGFAMVAGEGFELEHRDAGGVPVVAFYHPDFAERFRVVVDRTVEAVAWYEETYGFFPLDQVGIIQGHPSYGGGYPLPNMFAVHLGNLRDDHLAFITAHELGHYYWGYHVLAPKETAGSSDLDWLTLALGIWSDQRYLADRKGIPLDEQFRRDRGQGSWIVDYLEVLTSGLDQRLLLSPAEQAALTFDYNSLVRHGKAATGVYLQSMLIGPDRFLDLQRRILREYEGRPLGRDDFVSLLEQSGSPDAGAFFEAWYQHNAAVDMVLERVEPDESGGWRVIVRRTGSVPYPLTVLVQTPSGERRYVVDTDAEADTLSSPEAPTRVVIDPDGIVPMPNSSHPDMRSALAVALDRARRDEPFVTAARALLMERPDDHYVRYRLTSRLYAWARYDEAATLWPADLDSCDERELCLVAYYAAQSLARLGRGDDARALAENLAEDAERVGLAATWRGLEERLRD